MIVNVFDSNYESAILLDLYGGDAIDIPKFRVVKSINNIKPDKKGNINLDLGLKYEGNLYGKTIVHFGDSICEGATYHEIIKNRTGAETLNVGIGGTQLTHGNGDYGYFSFVDLVDAIITKNFDNQDSAVVNIQKESILSQIKKIDLSKVDIITVAYGTNDFTGNKAFGEKDSLDVNTFYGALNYTYQEIMRVNPKIQIYYITPIYRDRIFEDGKNSDNSDNVYGKYLRDYVNCYLEFGKKTHCPVLNLYDNSGINQYNAVAYLGDKLHPNDFGNEILGNKVCNFILSN